MQTQSLSTEQIAKIAPSIFASNAYVACSERYTYIPTCQVLNALQAEGFEPFRVSQTKSIDENHRGFAKHLIRLRHVSSFNDDDPNEIILINSHDGTSSYRMMAGVYRVACANGLICGNTLNEIRVHHTGDIIGRVIEGAYEILKDFEVIDAQKDSMKSIKLTMQDQYEFANRALIVRYGQYKSDHKVHESQLLQARRETDCNNDLWTVFNRIQENLTTGGLLARTATNRRSHTRPITGIDNSIRLNRALWTVAEDMQQRRTL